MNSRKLTIILGVVITITVFLTFIIVLRNIGGGLGGGNGKSATLTVWGVFDDHSAFDTAISNFRSQHPNISVKYLQVPYGQYEQTLVNALAAGTGPDVFMIHNTWLPKHGDKLLPMPAGTLNVATNKPFTAQDFKAQFVDVAYQDLTYQNAVYAMPLYVDSLALYYNKDLLNAAGITRPPQTWDEVNQDVGVLTKFNKANIIQQGIALGTARNINRSTDVLMDMMMQSGVQMTDTENKSATFDTPVNGQHVGEIALQYYTDFANSRKQNYSWNDSQHYSIDAFTEGTLAMMVGYSHDEATIKSKAPRLNFAVAPMPQASMAAVSNFANYWAIGVAHNSPNAAAAWQFVTYLTSKDGATAYLNAAIRPSARRDIIDLQRSDPDLGVFAVQALTAKSWFQPDNNAIETIFANTIDDVNYGRASVPDALSHAAAQTQVLFQQQ